MLIERELEVLAKRERKAANKDAKVKEQIESGEVEMAEGKKAKFKRGRILPRREYHAKRRQAKLVKYAPALSNGDVDMENRPKKMIPVSKTMRLVKDKDSISKQ